MKLILPIFLALFIVDAAASQTVPLQFAPIFTDSMVLQQQSEVAVWGEGPRRKKDHPRCFVEKERLDSG